MDQLFSRSRAGGFLRWPVAAHDLAFATIVLIRSGTGQTGRTAAIRPVRQRGKREWTSSRS
ncbi:hypothetical protein HOE425_331771 [Hoeflea sp. EC-HK425]|nr:hypothetical protein HOE425_331771 [Hoeflea sp. EC-HK425]